MENTPPGEEVLFLTQHHFQLENCASFFEHFPTTEHPYT